MSHDPSFRNESALDGRSSKEVTVRDDNANLVPDTANARADAEQAVNLFFAALLRPSRLGGAFP